MHLATRRVAPHRPATVYQGTLSFALGVCPPPAPRRSTGGNITLYSGNVLLAPLNCMQWTGQYGDARSMVVGTAAPDPQLFNADLAAQALLDHLQGTAVLPAAMLQQGA